MDTTDPGELELRLWHVLWPPRTASSVVHEGDAAFLEQTRRGNRVSESQAWQLYTHGLRTGMERIAAAFWHGLAAGAPGSVALDTAIRSARTLSRDVDVDAEWMRELLGGFLVDAALQQRWLEHVVQLRREYDDFVAVEPSEAIADLVVRMDLIPNLSADGEVRRGARARLEAMRAELERLLDSVDRDTLDRVGCEDLLDRAGRLEAQLKHDPWYRIVREMKVAFGEDGWSDWPVRYYEYIDLPPALEALKLSLAQLCVKRRHIERPS